MIHSGVRFPHDDPPAEGEACEIAPGVLWMRLPLPMALDHVNVFALDDGDGWTIIDTGFDSGRSRAVWQKLIAGPLGNRPITRVIVTHYHPDHIGLAGWFQEKGAMLCTTRTSWLYARMLVLDPQTLPGPAQITFWQRAGMPAARLAQAAKQRPFNFSDVVHPLPVGYTRIKSGDHMQIGGRDWVIHTGDGHAPEHATFFSMSDDLVIGGDQFLPGISANIGVYPTEPDADPLGEWLHSCRSFMTLAQEHHLVLPGHKMPFTGLPLRLCQMVENHEGALARLLDHLETPQTALSCFMPLFKREIGEDAFGMALVESVAHLNHLLQRGLVSRLLSPDGAWHWVRA